MIGAGIGKIARPGIFIRIVDKTFKAEKPPASASTDISRDPKSGRAVVQNEHGEVFAKTHGPHLSENTAKLYLDERDVML